MKRIAIGLLLELASCAALPPDRPADPTVIRIARDTWQWLGGSDATMPRIMMSSVAAIRLRSRSGDAPAMYDCASTTIFLPTMESLEQALTERGAGGSGSLLFSIMVAHELAHHQQCLDRKLQVSRGAHDDCILEKEATTVELRFLDEYWTVMQRITVALKRMPDDGARLAAIREARRQSGLGDLSDSGAAEALRALQGVPEEELLKPASESFPGIYRASVEARYRARGC